jgi:hypothetical protein
MGSLMILLAILSVLAPLLAAALFWACVLYRGYRRDAILARVSFRTWFRSSECDLDRLRRTS